MYDNLALIVRKLILNKQTHNMPWRKLGGGLYGHAYLLSDGKVLKVSRACDATALWIKEAAETFVRTGKPGQFMPRVYHYESCGRGWWAVMERVTPAIRTEQDDLYEVSPTCRDSVSSAMTRLCGCIADDLHRGNWGYAKCGRVVVFDPSANDRDIHHKVDRPIKAKRQHGPSLGRWAC